MNLHRRKAPVLVSLCVGLIVAALFGRWPTDRTSVVVIVVDTLRADAVSYKAGNEKTPHIAALAAEGVPFSLAFAHAPMTLPAHAAMFSGRHPFETGVLNNGQSFPENLPLLAERLASEGYTTRAVLSLATLWPEASASALDRGFESYDLGTQEVSTAMHTTPRLEAALDSLKAEEPFFLFAHFADPHEPYNDGGASGRHAEVQLDGEQVAVIATSEMSYWEFDFSLAPGDHELVISSEDAFQLRSLDLGAAEYTFTEGDLFDAASLIRVSIPNTTGAPLELHARAWLNDVTSPSEVRARYQAEVTRADRAIGDLIASLKARGLYEDTLIVLTSDHGEALGEHDSIGHVISLYDELLHVPLVVRLPGGRLDPRLVASRGGLVRHIDLAPTILEELGLSSLSNPSGSSLFKVEERTLLAETHPPEAPRTLLCARDEQYKLIYAPEEDSFEMYRLSPDPFELDNVFSHQGHLRETWQLILKKVAAETQLEAARSTAMQAKLSALGY